MFRGLAQRLLFLLFIGIPAALSAQLTDAGGIGAINLSGNLLYGLDWGFSQELRFNNPFSALDRSAPSVDLEYTLIRKVLKADVGYDFLYYNQTTWFEPRHRVAFALSLQQKVDPFALKLRSKIQSTWRDESRGDYKFNPKYVWRNKLEAVYTIFGSPVKPYLSEEIMCPLNTTRGFLLDMFRTEGGVRYRISESTTWQFFLRYDQEVQVKSPKAVLYGGVGWNYSF